MTNRVGLCESCAHARQIPHPRDGQGYWLCGYSERDGRYPRYPRLPVLDCPAYRDQDDLQARLNDR